MKLVFQKEMTVSGLHYITECKKYIIKENVAPNEEPTYFIFRKEKAGYNMLTSRATPELAKELCEILEGKE